MKSDCNRWVRHTTASNFMEPLLTLQVLTYHFLLYGLQRCCDGAGAAIRHVPAQTLLNVPVQLLKGRQVHLYT